MKTLALCLTAALIGIISAEPPSGYSYNRPSGGGGGGGYHFGGGGGGGGGFFGGGGGGNYISVAPGPSTNEGQYVEPQLLEKIRQLLLQEEANSHVSGGGGGGGGYPSSRYGVPSTQYGVPSYQTRVVGVDLEGIRQAIQVAQYQQTSIGPGGGGYNYAPASSYGAPRPSGSYGAPF